MLTEPFESESKKKWSHLSELVKETHRKVNESINKSSFSFKITNLFDSNREQIGLRCYCLGSLDNSAVSTLLYCDILNSEQIQPNSPLDNQHENADLDNLNLPVFKWKELLKDGLVKDDGFYEKLSKEEKLQMERKRLLITGIFAYEFHEQQRRFLFSLEGNLCYFDDNDQAPYTPIELPSSKKTAKINSRFCPSNPDIIAYCSDDELFVLNIQTGLELQITNCKITEPNRKIISGQSSYIIQEEFSRYVGYWWKPSNKNTNEYTILFEQVDETDVEIIRIATHDGSVEECRYPRPGKTNATSILKLVNFKSDSGKFYDLNVEYLNGISDFKQIYSGHEYLINCDWYTQDSVVVQLMNRTQKNLLVFLVSIDNKFPTQVLHEEINNEYWVYATQVCDFLRKDNDDLIDTSKDLNFIWASQESGFRHLYKYTVKLNSNDSDQTIASADNPLKSSLINKVQLTSGRWEVSAENVWLDSKNNLVYFTGLKDSPLENQLYVISLDNEVELIKKLTTSGYSNSLVVFNSGHSVFLNIQSSISKAPFGFLNVVQYSTADRLPSAHRAGYIQTNKITKSDGSQIDCVKQFEMLPGFSRPELFSYQLKESGDIVYGLIYKPHFMQADKKYPCVLEVYGGPQAQLIQNNFKSVRSLSRHLLASQGYVLCVFDCRGSANRGIAFEGHSYKRLGQTEIKDQVEVLQWLASNTNYIDLNRIAIYGYSYGGYLSLMAYATRPDIFKLCISGAPVTNWKIYDTGYTERYMDTPENNTDGYAKGSILNYVNNFPNECNRLLIIHGLNDENVLFNHSVELIHELVKANKPYSLQIYPYERHALGQQSQTRMHLNTNFLSFLNQNL